MPATGVRCVVADARRLVLSVDREATLHVLLKESRPVDVTLSIAIVGANLCR